MSFRQAFLAVPPSTMQPNYTTDELVSDFPVRIFWTLLLLLKKRSETTLPPLVKWLHKKHWKVMQESGAQVEKEWACYFIW